MQAGPTAFLWMWHWNLWCSWTSSSLPPHSVSRSTSN